MTTNNPAHTHCFQSSRNLDPYRHRQEIAMALAIQSVKMVQWQNFPTFPPTYLRHHSRTCRIQKSSSILSNLIRKKLSHVLAVRRRRHCSEAVTIGSVALTCLERTQNANSRRHRCVSLYKPSRAIRLSGWDSTNPGTIEQL